MSARAYDRFVAQKLVRQPPTGLASVPPLHDGLFPHQRDLVAWALRRGRAAIFADTGLGKTAMELEWARHVAAHTTRPVLVLAPLAVAQQTAREGVARLGLEVTVCREAADVRPGVNVTNYDRLHRFDPATFGGVVLDECFAAGTSVDCVDKSGRFFSAYIENVRPGDQILNATGVDTVADVHRREVPYAVRVTIGSRSIVVSPNHPFFTQRGWVGAQDLEPGDGVIATRSAVRVVREGVCPAVEAQRGAAAATVLQSILLSELADEHAGAQGEGPYARGRGEARRDARCVAAVGRPAGAGGDRAHPCAQPDVGSVGASEGLTPIEDHEARTFRAWGQRAWFDRAAADLAGCTWNDLGTGVGFVTGPTDSGLSRALQARLGESRAASRYRSGWQLAPQPEGPRREEGREAGFARVDGLEVLEPGHPDLERLRSADGKLYFYDLGASRHPSFSVAGLLVHNSSVIKHHDAKTLRALLDAFGATSFKLCATATPAPNDWTELGTHAEFLGVCTRAEMLAEFFVHDGGDTSVWRLKGHARAAFWRWVASWAALLRRPADLGHDTAGYDLPPLEVTQHVLPADPASVRATGLLFAVEARALSERRAARRGSLDARVAACAALVNAEPDEPWVVWCDLNDESAALARACAGAVEVRGSDDAEVKEQRLRDFAEGRARVLVSKSSICGFGLNWQHAARMAFVGVTDSFEAYYQAVRRCWRFGQTRPVRVHVFASELEGAVVANLRRKEADAAALADALAAETRALVRAAVRGSERQTNGYTPATRMCVPAWLTTDEEVAA